jgi:hypothetical protein
MAIFVVNPVLMFGNSRPTMKSRLGELQSLAAERDRLAL